MPDRSFYDSLPHDPASDTAQQITPTISSLCPSYEYNPLITYNLAQAVTMEPWSTSDVTNLAGIYTILFCMVGVCYMMCDPIGGFKQPPKWTAEEEIASTQAQARAVAHAQAAQ